MHVALRARRRATVAAACLAGPFAAIAGTPPSGSAQSRAAGAQRLSFSGWIGSATGSFAHDKGHLGIVITMRSGVGTVPVRIHLSPRPCPATGRCVRLSGTLLGTITMPRPVPDAGQDHRFRASGAIKPLGSVVVRGDWQTPGFIRNAHEQLRLTLSTAHGHLIIHAT
jgi:hypothetical protein